MNSKSACCSFPRRGQHGTQEWRIPMQEKNVEEKIIQNKKNGFPVLLGILAMYAVAIFGVVLSGVVLDHLGTFSSHLPLKIFFTLTMVLSMLVIALGWILFCGLKVLRPQEALVLTLFGNYIGTIKDDGFYFVNPFCSSVNPASHTKGLSDLAEEIVKSCKDCAMTRWNF